MKLYEALLIGGPATNARLAQHVSGAPGSLSYHLWQLAKQGFVEEAPELATDRRERWWRATPDAVRTRSHEMTTLSDAHAAHAYNATIADRHRRHIEEWVTTGHTRWDPAWQRAAWIEDVVMELDAEELRRFHSDLDDVIARWREYADGATGPCDTTSSPTTDAAELQRERIYICVSAFPTSGHLPVADAVSRARNHPDSDSSAAPEATHPDVATSDGTDATDSHPPDQR